MGYLKNRFTSVKVCNVFGNRPRMKFINIKHLLLLHDFDLVRCKKNVYSKYRIQFVLHVICVSRN